MAATHTFQAPKGTRDFYPADMAVRRHLESVWRAVAVSHGFDEIDGPTFEHLDLYTVKSGPGIVSELFSFRRTGGDTDYALRPEFTPTLARMVAARARELPRPTKWFSIGPMFRAERPQRGRLREHFQWNVDIVGDDSPRADAEVIAVAVGMLRKLGLPSKDVTIKFSHRALVAEGLREAGLDEQHHETAMNLLDRREKLDAAAFGKECSAIGLDFARFESTAERIGGVINDAILAHEEGRPRAIAGADAAGTQEVLALVDELAALNALKWCEFDLSIVRGLAYYTGTVFEIHEARGKERAIAGGGRYDNLVELFGGPPTPAVGFAMGDVVIRLVLEDHGLLESGETYLPRPEVFVISAKPEYDANLSRLVADLRIEGLHARHSYRATRNVGKLLGEAGKARARFAVILGEELESGTIVLKDLDAGEQREIAIGDALPAIQAALNQSEAGRPGSA